MFSRSFAIVFNEIRTGHLAAVRSGPGPCGFSSRPSQNSGVFQSWPSLGENMQCLDVRAHELILNVPCGQSPGVNVPKQKFTEGLQSSLDSELDA